jgi:rhodanese-related sulfurtransferase
MEPDRISIDELKRRMGRNEQIVFIDARSPQAYEESDLQIPGSVRVAPDDAETRVDEIPRHGLIVPYCTARHEKSSARVARVIREDGYLDVKPLLGGLNAWMDAGLPTQPKFD